MRWSQLVAIGLLPLLLVSCGGAKGKSRSSGNPPSVQSYTVHWLAPTGSIDGYTLSLGTQSGLQDQGEIDIRENLANERPDGSLEYVIRLDRSRDHYLVLRAYNEMGSSPPSNELRLPALGGSSMAAQSAAISVAATSSRSGDGSSAVDGFAATAAATLDDSARASAAAEAKTASATARASDEPLRSIDLNGVDEFLGATAFTPLASGGSFTLSLWVKPASDGGARRGLAAIASGASASRIELALKEDASGAALELLAEDARSGERKLHSAPIASPDDAWWHVAVVFDATRAQAAVLSGGIALADDFAVQAPADLLDGTAVRFSIGAADAEGGGAWSGRVGHAAIFDRALSGAELEQLVRLGHELDLRSNFGAYQGAPALLHYWRLGADASAIGRDSARGALPLDEAAGNVSAANIVQDAPIARHPEERPSVE